jgi:hypothetical protein
MQQPISFAQATPVAPVPKVILLVQSPAETKTDLQIFSLLRSSPMNLLHGSFIEINEKLHGLLLPLVLSQRKNFDHRPWRLVKLYSRTPVPGRQDRTARQIDSA